MKKLLTVMMMLFFVGGMVACKDDQVRDRQPTTATSPQQDYMGGNHYGSHL